MKEVWFTSGAAYSIQRRLSSVGTICPTSKSPTPLREPRLRLGRFFPDGIIAQSIGYLSTQAGPSDRPQTRSVSGRLMAAPYHWMGFLLEPKLITLPSDGA